MKKNISAIFSSLITCIGVAGNTAYGQINPAPYDQSLTAQTRFVLDHRCNTAYISERKWVVLDEYNKDYIHITADDNCNYNVEFRTKVLTAKEKGDFLDPNRPGIIPAGIFTTVRIKRDFNQLTKYPLQTVIRYLQSHDGTEFVSFHGVWDHIPNENRQGRLDRLRAGDDNLEIANITKACTNLDDNNESYNSDFGTAIKFFIPDHQEHILETDMDYVIESSETTVISLPEMASHLSDEDNIKYTATLFGIPQL